ncbi:hypothetical protein [Mycobacterium sp. URHB0044]|uniref:hypothetical protein n=1 Tax=Mycobacterium sp. URHB0044 TaxID=1380386 RepID=UPI00048EA570|nr:hypothetical protein [Mycobacterium sp. URHB0044]
MDIANYSVASERCARAASWPTVRRQLAAGGAVASAAILALGLVVAPPDVRGARTEVRQVQLSALTLSPPALLGALERFIDSRVHAVVPAAQAVAGGADIPAPVVKTPTADVTTASTFDAATDPAPNPRRVDAAAVAPTTAALAIPAPLLALIPQPILAIVGIALLFGPIIVLVILACPPCALFNFLSFTIPSLFIPFAPLSAVAEVSAASVEADATAATLPSDPDLSNSEPGSDPAAGPASRTRKIGKADAPAPTMSAEPASENDESSTDTVTPTKDLTETAKPDEQSTGPTAGSAPESSANDSAPEPTKPTPRRLTPRAVVHDSLEVGEHPRDLPHHAKGGHPTSGTADAGAATAGDAAPAGKTSGTQSPRGDSDDS